MRKALLLTLFTLVLSLYTYCIWQTAVSFHPVQQQIEINDWQKRNTNCHWQLLKANSEIKKLEELLNLKGDREDKGTGI